MVYLTYHNHVKNYGPKKPTSSQKSQTSRLKSCRWQKKLKRTESQGVFRVRRAMRTAMKTTLTADGTATNGLVKCF